MGKIANWRQVPFLSGNNESPTNNKRYALAWRCNVTSSKTFGGKWKKWVVIKQTLRNAPRMSVFVGQTPNKSSQSACQSIELEIQISNNMTSIFFQVT